MNFHGTQKIVLDGFPSSPGTGTKKLFSKGIENLGLSDDACFDHLSCEIMQSTTLQEKFFNLQLLSPKLSYLTVVLL